MMPSEDVELERFRRMGKAVGTLYQVAIETGAEAPIAAEIVKGALQMGFFAEFGGQAQRDWQQRQGAQLQLQQKQVELQERLLGLMDEAVAQLRALVSSQYEPEESRETTPDQAQL